MNMPFNRICHDVAHEEELSSEVNFLSNAPVKRALIPLIYGLCL